MSSPDLPELSMSEALERYGVLLLDAYGVLVRSDGPLPHAIELMEHLGSHEREYFILTNDASRLIETTFQRFERLGFTVPIERIITSGSLIERYFEEHDLAGASTLVLGPPDSHEYARRAGADLVPARDDVELDVLIMADITAKDPLEDTGTADFMQLLQAAVTALLRALDRDRPVRLLLPNPDLIYPRGEESYGITAGSIAAMIEHILRDRMGEAAPCFERLGKPHPYIFEEALKRMERSVEREELLMIGDQYPTDILGARRFGIDAAIVPMGLTRLDRRDIASEEERPTWVLPSLELP